MRVVVQRVSRASVSGKFECNHSIVKIFLVNGEIVSAIGRGLCLLVGLERDDTVEDLAYMHVLFNLCLSFNFESLEKKKYSA